MMTAAMLRNALNYDQETGVFTWKESGRGRGRKKGARAGSVKTSQGRQIRQINVNGHSCTAGVAAWLYVTGVHPKGIIEKKNNDPLDDSFNNLMDSSYSEIQKSRNISRNNSTGITGVTWKKADGGYYAVTIGGRKQTIYLGRTRDFFQACCMRKSAENKHKYNVTN